VSTKPRARAEPLSSPSRALRAARACFPLPFPSPAPPLRPPGRRHRRRLALDGTRALLSYVHDTADLQQENGGGAASPTAGGDGASPAGRAANLFPLFVIDYLSKRHGLRPIVEKMAWELAYARLRAPRRAPMIDDVAA